jgi:hypothetical protein
MIGLPKSSKSRRTTSPARRPEVIVKICRSSNFTHEASRDYRMRLLDGVRSDYEIIGTPPIAEAETVATGELTS